MQIRNMNISARAKSCLTTAGYQDVEELVNLSGEQLLSIRNLNASCVEEIQREVMRLVPAEDDSEAVQNNEVDTTDLIEVGIEEVSIVENAIMSKPIWNLGLSLRLCDILKSSGIFFVRDLCDLSKAELQAFDRLSYMNRREIMTVLEQNGLSLKD